MAPNLSSLLNRSADDAKRPVPLPQGTFFGTIAGHEFVESGKKKTPGVQYSINLSYAHEDVDMSEYESEGGKPVNERKTRTTFWLTEDSEFMLREFLESCGIETAGRSWGQLIPLAVGQPVVVDMTKEPRDDGEGFYNNAKRVVGVNKAAMAA